MSETLNLRSIPSMPSIYIDYILNFDRVRDLYRWDYRNVESVNKGALSCGSGLADKTEIGQILLKQNRRFGCDRSVEDNIEKLREGGCAVVTGQQIGLFCGPLYTVYKAATAIRLAEELNREGPDRHVPVFWMECEDHDILEAGHIHILGSNHRVLTLTAYEKPARRPTGSYRVDERVAELISQLEDNSPKSEYLDSVLKLLKNSYKPDLLLSEGFARFMQALFKGKGLVVIDPTDPEVKRMSSDFYLRAVQKWAQINDAIIEASGRLKKLGYELQIEIKKKKPPFFVIKDGQRLPLSWEGDGFSLGEGGMKLGQAEIESIARETPEQLSPNVCLRPLLQDFLLLTNAYVAGPGEVSYFAQIAPIYDTLDMDMPAIVPRAELTLVVPAVGRTLKKLGAKVDDFLVSEKKLTDDFLDKAGALSGLKIIDDARTKLEELLNQMCEELLDLEPEMDRPMETCRKKTTYQLSRLEEKLKTLSRKKNETLMTQIENAQSHLLPMGRLQERVLNITYYLIRFGLDFPQRILSEIDPFDFGHNIVRL